MKFELLSKNTMVLIDEVLKNQNLLKLIEYNDRNPLSGDDIVNRGALVMNKIIPAPFTGVVPKEQQTNLRIFFPDGRLQNRAVLDSTVVFQIVVHNNLWTISNKNRDRVLRPYEIMSELVKVFEDKSIKTLGVIHFKRFKYQYIDKDYGIYNLEAEMTTL